MTVIAGLVGIPGGRAGALRDRMLDSLAPYAGETRRTLDTPMARLGCLLGIRTPEDADDRQPIALPDGSVMLADIRLDNREDIAAALQISPSELVARSDSWLVARSWARWGSACLERVVGDFAIAVWNEERAELCLARSPFGARPLFYAHTGRLIAFATMPSAIASVDECDVAIDELAVAADVLNLDRPATETIYRNVVRVEPGHLLTFRDGASRATRFWIPNEEPLQISLPEAGERLREVLAVAASARLRSSRHVIASQLSAGRDSSAVTITAASLLAGSSKSLLALTGAPMLGANLPSSDNELYDESALAAGTAALSNIDHQISRPARPVSEELLAELSRLNQFPLGSLSNLPWQSAIFDDAKTAGADVLLNGQLGNSTVSVGGAQFLPDLLKEAGAQRWLAELWSSAPFRPLSLIRRSARTALPEWAYQRLARRGQSYFLADLLLTPQARQAVGERYGKVEWQPRRSARAQLGHALTSYESFDVVANAKWGLDWRDPTADRRVAELCLRLPASFLVGSAPARPAFTSAFGKHLPADVTEGRKRGYQGADWSKHFSPLAIEQTLREIEPTTFGGMLKTAEIRDLLSKWPAQYVIDPATYQTYRIGILGIYAAGLFMKNLVIAGQRGVL